MAASIQLENASPAGAVQDTDLLPIAREISGAWVWMQLAGSVITGIQESISEIQDQISTIQEWQSANTPAFISSGGSAVINTGVTLTSEDPSVNGELWNNGDVICASKG